MNESGERAGPAALLALPDYRRLWVAGGLSNAMRFLEMLAAALFTLDATGSAFAVALVTAARSAPMLLLGALTGVVADAWDRRLLLAGAMALAAATAALLGLTAWSGALTPLLVGLGAFLGGIVSAAEMSTRRRMLAETAGPQRIGPAIALDGVTNAVTRMIGPLAGGAAYATIGIAGAYAVSAALFALASLLVASVTLRHPVRRLLISRVPAELREGMTVARANGALMMVIAVTIVMNAFGFSYNALIAPLGRALWDLSPERIGLLAAAEPLGAFLGALALTRGRENLPRKLVFVGGSAIVFVALVGFALAPGFWPAFALLVLGGLGSAGFANMQTTLVLTETPAEARSRVLGLVTVCIGTGPLGALLAGTLAEPLGPGVAVIVMAVTGAVLLSLAAWRLRPEPPRL